jgi:hypothetical protein
MTSLGRLTKRGSKRNFAYEVIDILKGGEPVLAEELMNELGLCRAAASRHLKECHALDLIYICGWDRSYQKWVPRYRWGNKEDVKKPDSLSLYQIKTRYLGRKNNTQRATP